MQKRLASALAALFCVAASGAHAQTGEAPAPAAPSTATPAPAGTAAPAAANGQTASIVGTCDDPCGVLKPHLFVTAIDGVKPSSENREMDTPLPLTAGKHDIDLMYVEVARQPVKFHFWLVAAAGAHYQARYTREKGGFLSTPKVSADLVDMATGQPAGGVKGSEDEPKSTAN
jgi:hypothetical protein